MQKEIGSNFWLTPEELQLPNKSYSPYSFGCKGTDYVWMSTGRSAISIVLDTIESRNTKHNKKAILPPFTCHTVISPFLKKGYELATYNVSTNLHTDGNCLVELARKNKAGVILIHRYFGFDTITNYEQVLSELRQMGVVVIEDCTQILYSSFVKSSADYYVGSIRKWCGVPDGGFAICKEGRFENKPNTKDVKLEYAKKQASISKYNYLFRGIGEKKDFLNLYRKAEDILDNQSAYYTISDLSMCVQSNLDISVLKEKRRKNYETLAKGLNDTKNIKIVFPELPSDVTPLYCPILCDNRSIIQSRLVRNSIYAPVVWPKADCCPKVDGNADYLYDNLLCIPIDQRYDIDDICRIINTLK